jgi:hypothetical protein
MDKVREFKPQDESIDDWVTKFTTRCELLEIKAENYGKWCRLQIGTMGDAALIGLPIKTEWGIVKQKLLSTFGPKDKIQENTRKLKAVRRKEEESLKQLSVRIGGIAREAFADCPEERQNRETIKAFISAIPETWQSEIRKFCKKEMGSVLEMAEMIEEEDQRSPKISTAAATEEIAALRREVQQLQNESQAKSNDKQNIECYACGKRGHFARECRSKKFRCYTCNKTGHMAKDCQSGKQSDGSALKLKTQHTGNQHSMGRIGALTTVIIVGGEVASMMVDTGADRSCLSHSFFEKNKRMLGPLSRYTGVLGADGQKLKTFGLTKEMTVKWQNEELRERRFLVLPALGSYDGILGMDIMPELDININTRRKTVGKESEKQEVRLIEDISIGARTEIITAIKIENWNGKIGIFEPEQSTLPEGIKAVATLTSANRVVIKIQNDQESPVRLQHGWKIGEVSTAEVVHQTKKGPKPAIPNELEQEKKNDLQKLLEEYADIFATSDSDRGKTDYIQHKIKTTGGPIKQTFRRQPPERRRIEQTQVTEMLETKAIEESQSPWSSPVVLVKKKDNTYRFCIDFRRLNDVTIKDAQPLPRIDDTLESLYGARWFTTLDLQSGYWQVPLNEDDKEKTAFVTGDGNLYQFNVMPFGLCNAGATFSRLMESVLKGLTWRTCLAYLDDIIVFGKTWTEHLERLKEVFDRIRKAGLKLKARKCTLASKEVDFLGHHVSEDGIQPDKQKASAIQSIKPPNTVKELRSFLGIASYYRRFIRNFAKIADPLHELLKKGVKFNWTVKCQQAFVTLKTALISPPIMAYPDFDRVFEVYTDASNVGMGAVLMQRQGKDNRVIAYASKSLNKSERNYSATKKEALALVWALRHFRPYLYKPFRVYTDHYALKWLRHMKGGAALLHRWCLELEEYQFEVIHKPGLQQGHADGLSRLPLETDSTEEEEEDHIWQITIDTEKETRRLLRSLHKDPSAGGHLGYKLLLKKFQERYKSPWGSKLAKEVTQACDACQRHSDYGSKELSSRVQGGPTPESPWDVLSVDSGAIARLQRIPFYPDNSGYVLKIPVNDSNASAYGSGSS